MKHFISLGAGVQSSTMSLMAKHGEITPMPDAAIFADTHVEPQAVYEWLDWLETQLPFPVYRVSKGNLGEDMLKLRARKDGNGGYIQSNLPAFTKNPDGTQGHIPRQCTSDYKIKPIMKKVRQIANIKRGEKEVRVIQWHGISYDELMRMKESRDPWCQIRYPLIELRMSRWHCLKWMNDHGYPRPPRSACVFCPFHSDDEWRNIKDNDADGWERAVYIDREYRQLKKQTAKMKGYPYLHRSCVPLDEVDFNIYTKQTELWGNECGGYCGV